MGLSSIFLSSIFLSLCGDKLGESHSGELHRETAEQRANRILAEEMATAARLRNETTLPIKWIAARV